MPESNDTVGNGLNKLVEDVIVPSEYKKTNPTIHAAYKHKKTKQLIKGIKSIDLTSVIYEAVVFKTAIASQILLYIQRVNIKSKNARPQQIPANVKFPYFEFISVKFNASFAVLDLLKKKIPNSISHVKRANKAIHVITPAQYRRIII